MRKRTRTVSLLALAALAAAACPLCAGTAPAEATFEQVLARPDDPDLNYRYALARVEAGDLLPALSALERVIAAAPKRYEALLVHALVLYRLESLDEASRELEVLEKLPLEPGLRARIRQLQAEIRRRQSSLRLSARLGGGVENNSNRKALPSSGKMLFNDSLVDVSAAGKADTSASLFAGADFWQDLGSAKGHELSESITYYRTEQGRVKPLNMDALSARVAGRYRTSAADAVLELKYAEVMLARRSYLRNPGAALRLERRSRSSLLFLEESFSLQRFVKNPVSSGAPDRAGSSARVSLGWERQAGAAMRLGAEYGLSWKDAAAAIYNYAEHSLSLSHVWFPGKGAFLESSLGCSLASYPTPNTFVSRRRRKDTALKAGMTLGLPLGPAWRALRDVLLSVSGEAQNFRSTITNYSYNNYRAGLTLSWRWQAGF